MEEELRELRQTLAQVHQDSKEIEEVLEAELEAKEQECKALQTRLESVSTDADHWKANFESLQSQLKIMETQNDDYEQSSRIKEATISKLEQENQLLLEKLALTNVDMAHNQETEVDLQRTKQSLVEAEEEILKLRAQLETQTKNGVEPSSKPSEARPSAAGLAEAAPSGGNKIAIRIPSRNAENDLDKNGPIGRSRRPSKVALPAELRSSEWSRSGAADNSRASNVAPLRSIHPGKGHGSVVNKQGAD